MPRRHLSRKPGVVGAAVTLPLVHLAVEAAQLVLVGAAVTLPSVHLAVEAIQSALVGPAVTLPPVDLAVEAAQSAREAQGLQLLGQTCPPTIVQE